jgi:hypothetical protein
MDRWRRRRGGGELPPRPPIACGAGDAAGGRASLRRRNRRGPPVRVAYCASRRASPSRTRGARQQPSARQVVMHRCGRPG